MIRMGSQERSDARCRLTRRVGVTPSCHLAGRANLLALPEVLLRVAVSDLRVSRFAPGLR